MKFPFILPANRKFDVIGFGTNAVDFLIQVPQYPSFNSKIELSDYLQLAGGEVATTMVGVSRLGLKTAYIGRFGSDKEGDFGRQTLIDEQVDVTFAEKVSGAKTQIAFILIDERSGERTVIWHRDKMLAYEEKDSPVAAAALGKILHLTPHDALACLQMVRRAKSENTVVSLDIDNIFDGVDELLPQIDILISSADFPAKIFGINDEKESLRKMKRQFGCKIVGMTLGEKGSLLLCENEFIKTDGFSVPNGCKDTTGAGDAFRVGLLYGLLKNESIESAARMANAVAALKCRAFGARTSLPIESELLSFLDRRRTSETSG